MNSIEAFYLIRSKKIQEAIEFIDKYEIDINSLDENKCTFMHNIIRRLQFSREKYPIIFKLFLERGADPNIPCGKNRDTILMFSVIWNMNNLILLLLEYGADPYIEDVFGENSIQKCKNNKYNKDTIKIIEEGMHLYKFKNNIKSTIFNHIF